MFLGFIDVYDIMRDIDLSYYSLNLFSYNPALELRCMLPTSVLSCQIDKNELLKCIEMLYIIC